MPNLITEAEKLADEQCIQQDDDTIRNLAQAHKSLLARVRAYQTAVAEWVDTFSRRGELSEKICNEAVEKMDSARKAMFAEVEGK